MHGEGERAGVCKAAIEIIVPVLVTACFLNTHSCASYFCSGKGVWPLLGK